MQKEKRAMTQIDPIMTSWTVYRWVLKRAVLAMVAVALLTLVA
jgi:hypothetical protein